MICSPVLGQATFFFLDWRLFSFFLLYPLYYAFQAALFALDTLVIYYVLTRIIGNRRRSVFFVCLQQMRRGRGRSRVHGSSPDEKINYEPNNNSGDMPLAAGVVHLGSKLSFPTFKFALSKP